MESPRASKRKNTGEKSKIIDGCKIVEYVFQLGETTLPKVNCTPKNHRSSFATIKEFGLYNLHGESSPNFRAGQDVLEVGWGDSPEPLNVDQKLETLGTEIACKKKLETKESPKSSIPPRKRNVRSLYNIPSKSIIDASKYVAEVQELSKNLMKEFNGQITDKDRLKENSLVSTNQLIENELVSRLSPVQKSSYRDANKFRDNGNSSNKDSLFDSVLQSFINEEDDWLSQALSSHEQIKPPSKVNFVKSKSENELILPQSTSLHMQRLTLKCENKNNNFQRTSSFDLAKPQNKYKVSDINDRINMNKKNSSTQYSHQEIERKRLEAKYRRERREIERKKLEALKKLEMKKMKAIKI